MAQDGPTAGTVAQAGAGPPHQKNPCTRCPRCGQDDGFDPGLQVKALEAVGRPPAPVLNEDPNHAG